MFWYEYISQIKALDVVNERALKRYAMWQAMIRRGADRAEIANRSLDPDGSNEFCYYPLEYWDRVIRWHKEVQDFEQYAEFSMPIKMLRAGLLYMKMDPELWDTSYRLPVSRLQEVYDDAVYNRGQELPPFSEVVFGVNPFSHYLEVAAPEAAEAFTPLGLDTSTWEEEPEQESDPQHGYWLMNADCETHLYPSTEINIHCALKQNLILLGCDRYGNKLHPCDPYLYEQSKRENIPLEEIILSKGRFIDTNEPRPQRRPQPQSQPQQPQQLSWSAPQPQQKPQPQQPSWSAPQPQQQPQQRSNPAPKQGGKRNSEPINFEWTWE